MRVLFDMAHPAHVHYYRNLIRELTQLGHGVTIVSRSKDVTNRLLDGLGLPYTSVGTARRGLLALGIELLQRDFGIAKAALREKVDVIMTRNPAGAQAGRLLGTTTIFDTDDGPSAGIHYRLAAAFAHIITTPDCITQNLGSRHRPYPSYKALAYLHPDRFTPDPSVGEALSRGSDRYFIVRFVAMAASHDTGEAGLSEHHKRELIRMLQAAGNVFITSERPLPPDLAEHRFPLSPDKLHDALYFASGYVGDSQTVAFEAGLLGTPAVHCSTWSRRLECLNELEDKYGLVRSFPPSNPEDVTAAVAEFTASDDLKPLWDARRSKMLDDKVDLTTWNLELLHSL